MPKIAMIGAGSLVFCKTLIMDILATEALRGSEICLMSRTKPKLDRMEGFVKRVINENDLPAKVTVDARPPRGARGRRLRDRHDPGRRRRCLQARLRDPAEVRRRPVHRRLPRPRRRLPRAAHDSRPRRHRPRHGGALPRRPACSTTPTRWRACCYALGKASTVPFIGLCHGVQTTLDLISRYVDVPKDQIDYLCAGINHMALVPVAAGQARRPRPLPPPAREHREARVLRQREGARRGHAPLRLLHDREHRATCPSTCPGSAASKRALELYCDEPDFGGASGAYYKYCEMLAEKYGDVDYLALESPKLGRPQRRVLLLHPRGRGDGQPVPPQRQRAQRRLHHQPARGLLRRGAGVRRRRGACTPCASATCRRSARR